MKGFSFSAAVTGSNVVEFHGSVDLTALHLLTGKGYIVVPGGKESEWLKALAEVFAKAEAAAPPSPAELFDDLNKRLDAIYNTTRPFWGPERHKHPETVEKMERLHGEFLAAFDLARKLGEAVKGEGSAS